jgi:hypothetical protein
MTKSANFVVPLTHDEMAIIAEGIFSRGGGYFGGLRDKKWVPPSLPGTVPKPSTLNPKP